jgi:5-methylcytosine-specific restriction endonuclease McrA
MDEADILSRAVASLIAGCDKDARQLLQTLPCLDPVRISFVNATVTTERFVGRRRPIPPALRAQIYQRDYWICRYCGRRVVVPGVIELVGALCPAEFPFPSHNMPGGLTHPAAVRLYPNVDHIRAGSVGGWEIDAENLVTACTRCNELKSDKPGWLPSVELAGEWDGLANSYKALAERIGVVRQYHLRWFAMLGI